MTRWLRLGAATAVLALLALCNLRLQSSGGPEIALAQVRFLGDALNEGAAEHMQEVFPEGYVFTWALYGLAAAQIARPLAGDDSQRSALLDRVRTAVEHVDSEHARSSFPRELIPSYGAFYNSWSLYLRAEYLRAAGPARMPADFIRAFEADCARFATNLSQSPTPFLPSYAGSAWPADTCVGVAALAIRDQLLGTKYVEVISRWAEEAQRRLDPTLHALSHAADPVDGAPRGGVRGASLALMARVLAEAAPELAAAQYGVLKSHFVDYSWGLPAVREYPRGTQGPGDVDSGPLILNYSGPATVVGAAAARANGDEHTASALFGVIEMVGFPVQWNGRRRYALGAIPVGDAFIVWARSSSRAPSAERDHINTPLPWWWAFPVHALSLTVVGPILWGLWTKRRSGS